MEPHSSIAMFISEIPVRCQGEKTIKWIGNLNNQTTVHDIISSIYPKSDSKTHTLYIHIGRYRKPLNESSLIYKIVSDFHQEKSSKRLLFEIRLKKKHVRFADEIVIQNINGRHISNEKNICNNIIETISMPIEKRLEVLKENFHKNIQKKQEIYTKSSSSKRGNLSIVNKNICVQKAIIKQIPRSSSESGISSSSSNDDLNGHIVLETLV